MATNAPRPLTDEIRAKGQVPVPPPPPPPSVQVVHSKSVGRRQAVLEGRDPAGEMVTKVELEELRRKADAWDAYRWAPIDTAPKDGSQVLVRNQSGYVSAARFDACMDLWMYSSEGVFMHPTHWCPIRAFS